MNIGPPVICSGGWEADIARSVKRVHTGGGIMRKREVV